MTPDYQRRREAMVQRQLIPRGISDSRVLDAMRTIPRHLFVSESLLPQAYEDYPLPIGEQQTISQPYMVAEMTQALQISPNDRVLEIGTGSGYQTAILAHLAQTVYSVERISGLLAGAQRVFQKLPYTNIITRLADGTIGWPEESPFDAIIVTAGAPDIPKPLVDQLGVGGRMVIPVGNDYIQRMIKIFREPTGLAQTHLSSCCFVKLIGEHGWSEG